MSTPTREAIMSAFWTLVSATPGFAESSRRFKHWDQVSGNNQLPFMTMLQGTEDRRRRTATALPDIVFNVHVFVYTSAGLDSEDVPATSMNALLDALDAQVVPAGSDLAENRQTLGGLVTSVYALGSTFVDTGDIDGVGVAAVPFQIVAPWY